MAITLNGTTGITTPTYGGAVTAEYIAPVTSFKNRIINGAMQIDQRNAGASFTPTNSSYGLDRWRYQVSQTSKLTSQQSSVAPAGFIDSLLVTSSSAYSVLAADFFILRQRIEGYNVADLNWGTANAATVTISFWVRSSLTGTFGGSVTNSAANRSYPFTYTISSANTWEQKSITIAGDTTGTWLADNSTGIAVNFSLGAGTTYSGTAGSWAAADYASATGATSVVGTNGATFYITGVQLEKGSTATSFDYRPYTTELQLCQRYYQIIGDDTTDCVGYATYSNTTALSMYTTMTYLTMRAAPTATVATFITANTGQPTVQAGTSSLSFSLVATSANLRVAARSGTNAKPIQLSAEL
jgi:hypothetical protein